MEDRANLENDNIDNNINPENLIVEENAVSAEDNNFILKIEEEGKQCIICMENYSDQIIRHKISCGHVFCKNCIIKCTEINPFCPLCRAPVDRLKEFNIRSEINNNANLNGNHFVFSITTNGQTTTREFNNLPMGGFTFSFGNNNRQWNIQTVRNIFSFNRQQERIRVIPRFNDNNNNNFSPFFSNFRPGFRFQR